MRMWTAAIFFFAAAWCHGAQITMNADVDGTELPRRLLHARLEIPAAPGQMALWYPKWIPGIHFFGGPVHNLTGLKVRTAAGGEVPWRRDETEYWRFLVDVPEGADRIVVELDYITNQPTTQSTGVDSYGFAGLGAINFNTCLLYPEGFASADIAVRLRVKLPEAWRAATSLSHSESGEWLAFDETDLETVIDSPLLCGAYMKSLALDAANGPKAYLHMAGTTPAAIDVDEQVRQDFTRVMAEAYSLFGGAPFDDYHFLLALSADIPRIGLEHLRSSLNAEGERDMVDAEKRKDGIAYLLPHELAHAWCGKWRRPEGMAAAAYHQPLRTKHLWIYEGLDQYLGEVLMVRAGLISAEEYIERFAVKLLGLQEQRGREWRSLEDTAVFAGPLRGASASWGSWRRGQDYYNEGLLIWLEADAYIRRESKGRRSLDDFCRTFFAHNPGDGAMKPFALDEVCAALNDLAPRDWAAFFEERVARTQTDLSVDFVDLLGYRIVYNDEPSAARKKADGDRKRLDAREALGLIVNDDGEAAEVVPGSPADAAGLAPGMRIAAIDGWRYTRERMAEAIAASATSGRISLLAVHGDRFREMVITYDGGARYLALERIPDRADLFVSILAPRLERE